MICADGETILSSITTLKYQLADFIEPDFGLLDELLRLEMLSRRQCAKVRSERTVYERNDALLELLTSVDRCDKFLGALQRSGQQHVVNFVTQNGGQRNNDSSRAMLLQMSQLPFTLWSLKFTPHANVT